MGVQVSPSAPNCLELNLYLHRSAKVGFSRYLSWQLAQAVVITSAASTILPISLRAIACEAVRAGKLLPGAKESQVEDRAIILQRTVAAENLDGMEKLLHPRICSGAFHKSIVSKHLTRRVLRFRDAVGNNDQMVARLQAGSSAGVVRV
jgi:hypothetical protein